MNKLTLTLAATLAIFGAQVYAADATPATAASPTTAAAPAKSDAKPAVKTHHKHHAKKAAAATKTDSTATPDAPAK
jgi:hypothetical protein